MKGILCDHWGHYSELAVAEVPVPLLGPGQVRIAVHYATVGFGQTLIVAGTYQRKPSLPFVPGTEVSGIVTAVADDVSGFQPGDRVVAALDWGGYAQQAVASACTTWHVPAGVDLAIAAGVALGYGTAYAALHWRARIQPGDSLLVLGAAGGVGLPAVQLGRLAGAHGIAVAGSQERVDTAIRYGAHEGLVHGGDALGKRVLALRGGRGVDIVFDPVGGPLFGEALRCISPEGRILLIGFASGEVPAIPANHLLVKNAEVIGFYYGLYVGWGLTDQRKFYEHRVRTMVNRLFEHVARGELAPVASVRYPMARFVEAFDAVVQRRSIGRAILQISDEAVA